MHQRIKAFVVLISMFSLLGCTTRLVDFTIISTKNLDLSRAGSFERGKSRIEGRDEALIIIFIPTGIPSIKEAIDRAIESVPGGVALVDGVVSVQSWWLIFGMTSYVVEGTPLIDKSLAAAELESKYMTATLDKKGNVKEFRYVSAEEYRKLRDKHLKGHEQIKL